MGRADQFQKVLYKLAKSCMETKVAFKPEAEREERKQFGSMLVVVRTMGRVENGEGRETREAKLHEKVGKNRMKDKELDRYGGNIKAKLQEKVDRAR